MIRRDFKIPLVVMLTMVVLACAPSLVPGPAPAPTFDPNLLSTTIIETANAAAAQTELVASPVPTSTETPLPSLTPSITPTPTATFIFVLATPTVPSATPQPGSSGKALDCQIVSMAPENDSRIVPNTEFSMAWNVMNMGTEIWDANNTDYRYVSGAKMHTSGIYDLEVSVAPGEQTEIRVAMKAPGSTGSYTTSWVIRAGKTDFCKMSLTIQVP